MRDELHLLGALAKSTGNRVILWAAAEVARLREERRGWLTSEERETLEDAADAAEAWGSEPTARVIRALLARETPPKVKVPHLDDLESDERPVWESACREWIAAIRAAGGEVEE